MVEVDYVMAVRRRYYLHETDRAYPVSWLLFADKLLTWIRL